MNTNNSQDNILRINEYFGPIPKGAAKAKLHLDRIDQLKIGYQEAAKEVANLVINPHDPRTDIYDRLGLVKVCGQYMNLKGKKDRKNKLKTAYYAGRVFALKWLQEAFFETEFPDGSEFKQWNRFHEELVKPWVNEVNEWANQTSDKISQPPSILTTARYVATTGLKPRKKDKPVQTSVRHMKMISLADVEAKELEWLWDNRFPAKMVNVLAGEAGVGKSYLSLYMTTQLTTGGDWPDCENTIEPGTVLLFTDEESLEYAVKPRLMAHGADCSKVMAFDCIQTGDNEETQEGFALDSAIKELEDLLDTIPDCRLIIFDPINSYLGDIKENSNKEVRQGLTKLSRIADKWGVTILCITHLNKKWDISTMHRVMGSTAFTSVARAVWCVRFEEADEDEELDKDPPRLFAHVKSNFCRRPTALRYEITDDEKIMFLEGEVRVNINALVNKAKKTGGKKASKKEAITAWLKERIGDEPVLADDLKAEADEKGFFWRYVQTVANHAGIIKEKSDQHNGKSIWKWNLKE